MALKWFYRPILSWLNAIVLIPLIPACAVSLEVLCLVHYSSLYRPILPLSVPLFHPSNWTIIFMLTTRNFLFSFYPQGLDLSIVCLQNAIHQISSWITANRLSWAKLLIIPKTEFLLIGLKQQLAKLHDHSLTHSARNLGFIFDEHLITLSNKISALS